MNDKFNKSQTGGIDKQSMAETLDNMNLANHSEENTKTDAVQENIRVESSKQDDDKKTYTNSYMQHNSSDFLALDNF